MEYIVAVIGKSRIYVAQESYKGMLEGRFAKKTCRKTNEHIADMIIQGSFRRLAKSSLSYRARYLLKMLRSQTTEYLLNEGIKDTHYKLALVLDDQQNSGGKRLRLILILQLLPVFGAKTWALSACQAEAL